jgi:hypothetical protein
MKKPRFGGVFYAWFSLMPDQAERQSEAMLPCYRY